MKYANHAWRTLGLVVPLATVLVACGGGSDNSSGGGGGTDLFTDPGTSVPGLRTGVVVVNGPVRNAVVCMDLNANTQCDAGEPVSAKTGADGAYSLSYDPAQIGATQLAAASLITRMVPGDLANPNTTIDMGDGETTTDAVFWMRQVPGKAGQINPLTTLLAVGVGAGMTEAAARANAATQLGVAESKLGNYQDDPAFSSAELVDNARLAALITAATLEDGVALRVGDQSVAFAAAPNDLRSLAFTDTNNFSYLAFDLTSKPAGPTTASLIDLRVGKTAGAATDASALYNQAYLTATGWLRCDHNTPITFTQGSPNRSMFCDVRPSLGWRGVQSIAGRGMAEVVTELQSDNRNFINTGGLSTAGLLSALGAAAFPANSTLRPGTLVNLNRPIFINSLNTDGLPQSLATNLEQLIAARPASGVNLGNGGGTLSLGLGSSNAKVLRVAFTGTTSASDGTVQYYQCDLSANGQTLSNCDTSPGTGSYAISTINGSRVMRFAGHPATVMNHIRLYVEVLTNQQRNGVTGSGDWVYQARETKADLDSNVVRDKRLNGVAWTAMKTQLGL